MKKKTVIILSLSVVALSLVCCRLFPKPEPKPVVYSVLCNTLGDYVVTNGTDFIYIGYNSDRLYYYMDLNKDTTWTQRIELCTKFSSYKDAAYVKDRMPLIEQRKMDEYRQRVEETLREDSLRKVSNTFKPCQ